MQLIAMMMNCFFGVKTLNDLSDFLCEKKDSETNFQLTSNDDETFASETRQTLKMFLYHLLDLPNGNRVSSIIIIAFIAARSSRSCNTRCHSGVTCPAYNLQVSTIMSITKHDQSFEEVSIKQYFKKSEEIRR